MDKIEMSLGMLDGNAFAIMGRFHANASSAGWSEEDISGVLDEAMMGDYQSLLETIAEHCENGDELIDMFMED